MELPDWLANKKKRLAGWWVIQMELPNLLVTEERKTKFMSNYMKVLELFGNRNELTGYLSFEKIM